MRRAPVFRRRERLGVTAVVLLTYVLSSYVSYAIVSVLLDGRGLLEALIVGLNPGWALLPLGFFAALFGGALFGVLGLARRFDRRAAFAVIAVLSTVGGLRLIAFAGEAALVMGGTVQNVTPGGNFVHLITEVLVSLLVVGATVLAAFVAARYLVTDDRTGSAR